MNALRIKSTAIGLVSVAIVAGVGNLARGAIIGVVSPSSTTNVEGNRDQRPNLMPLRIQHLIPATDFAGLPASHRSIVAFNFRADITQNQSIDWTAGDERVWMSTTSLVNLTTNFDNNHGADRTLVHDGPLPFPLLATGPVGGPRDFAAGPRLDTPFFYDPSQGNLLIDRVVFVANPSPLATIDTQLTTFNRILLSEDPNSATGTRLQEVAVIRLEFVPEPSALVLTGFASMCLVVRRRKNG
jgi:hypothetical protein